MIVGIVDYGIAGNIHSITKALAKAGAQTVLLKNARDFELVQKLIIPGVGSFPDAMSELEKSGIAEALKNAIATKPTLGICLGMQILSSLGFEYGKTAGLGAIDAEVKPMIVDAKVPHMGFGAIDVIKTNAVLKGLENEKFYFMHSYEVVNYTDIAALTTYGGHRFVSAICKGNLFGVQFHPEKSREAGIQLFRNFVEM